MLPTYTKYHHQLTNLHHLAQLCQIASDEVKESKFVKVLRPLIAHFHNLVVALQQCSFTKALPTAALIQCLCSFQSYLQVQDKRFNHIFAQVQANANTLKLIQVQK